MNPIRKVINAIEAWAGNTATALWFARWFGTLKTAPSRPLNAYRRILVIKPDEIGDFVMVTPFLRTLRRLCARGHITLLVKPGVQSLAVSCPYIDELKVYDWEAPGRFPLLRRLWRILKLTAELRKSKFDLAIFPRWDADHYGATQVLALCGATRRVSYSEKVAEWKPSGLDVCLTDAVQQSLLQHEVLQNLQLLRALGGDYVDDRLELWISEPARVWARQRAKITRPGERRIAIVPGARQGAKRWPFPFYQQLGERLIATGANLVILGSTEDRSLGDWVPSPSVIDLRGEATLEQSAAVLETCDLYVGNDTGLKHIAAALEKPVTELSCHPLNASPRSWPWPERFHAWKTPTIQLRPKMGVGQCTDGCHSDKPHCIAWITPQNAWATIEPWLAQRAVA